MLDKPIKILITDDIEDNRIVLKTICKKLGNIEILEAGNGLEATRIVDTQEIDIVLMDVMMPVMDGFEATKIIKELPQPPYVLIVTAVTDKETEDKFASIGVDGYVRKPIDKEAIVSRLEVLKSACLIKKGLKSGLSSKKPLSKQASKCRNFKTYFLVENEEDAMNLGLWLTDYKNRYGAAITFEFEDTLSSIYKICKMAVKQSGSITIVAEEDFENIYLTFIPMKSVSCGELSTKIGELARQNFICDSTLLYLTIGVTQNQQHPIAEPITIKPETNDDKEKISVTDEDIKHLRKSHTEKISAVEFVSEFSQMGSMDEIYDLQELEDRWRELVSDFAENKTKAALTALEEGAIDAYARVINKIYEFSAIGYALSSLCAFIRGIEESRTEELAPKLSLLLEHILDDLINWRNTIFVSKSTADIHYLDSSLLSSCMQIDAIVSQKAAESADEDDELELF